MEFCENNNLRFTSAKNLHINPLLAWNVCVCVCAHEIVSSWKFIWNSQDDYKQSTICLKTGKHLSRHFGISAHGNIQQHAHTQILLFIWKIPLRLKWQTKNTSQIRPMFGACMCARTFLSLLIRWQMKFIFCFDCIATVCIVTDFEILENIYYLSECISTRKSTDFNYEISIQFVWITYLLLANIILAFDKHTYIIRDREKDGASWARFIHNSFGGDFPWNHKSYTFTNWMTESNITTECGGNTCANRCGYGFCSCFTLHYSHTQSVSQCAYSIVVGLLRKMVS